MRGSGIAHGAEPIGFAPTGDIPVQTLHLTSASMVTPCLYDRRMAPRPYGIFLSGSYGVGKSSTLDHLGDLFAQKGLPFSLLDIDWFHRSWPLAPYDPDNTVIEAQNLAAVWQNYLGTGPRTPIIAGVIRTRSDLDRYQAVFTRELKVVHLTASPDIAAERLRRRYDSARSEALSWHLARHVALATDLHNFAGHTVTVHTDNLAPAQVAQEIFDSLAPAPG